MGKKSNNPKMSGDGTNGSAVRESWLRSTFARDLGLCAGIFLLTLLVYWPSVNGAFLWDDPAHVTAQGLRDWDGLARIFFELGTTQEYYPILHGAFWVQYQLWGESVTGYHLFTIFLHAANCCLLAVVLRRLWQPQPQAEGPASPPTKTWAVPKGTEWLAAFLFAVHPVCVESVAWITEQKNTLSLAFYLLSALCYLDFTTRRRGWMYGLAFVFFLLAMGSKTMTVTLPAALLVVLWWKNGRMEWKRDVVPLVPWFFAALAAGLVTMYVESSLIGAQGEAYQLSVVRRVLLASRSLWFSLGKLLWPSDLMFFYPRWDVAEESMGWIVHLIAALIVTAAVWFIRKRSRGPLAAWLLYGGTLVPVLGFFNVYSFIFAYVADHYQYLAIPVVVSAIAAIVGVGIGRLAGRLQIIVRVTVGVVLAGLAVQSHHQSKLYQDNETLFRANIAANPESWMAHRVLGLALSEKSPEYYEEAVSLYRRAVELSPDNAESHYKLGYILAQRPETLEEGVDHYREALRLRPTYPEAHNNLGLHLSAVPGREQEAIDHFRKAVQAQPRFLIARLNLARALMHVPAGRSEAIEHFEAALRLNPNVPSIYVDLANTLALDPGRASEAIAHYETALRLDPNQPWIHFRVAILLARVPGRLGEATAHAQEAVRLSPDFVEAYNFLGVLSARAGDMPAAQSYWNRALRIDPQFQPARDNLSRLEQGEAR